MPLLFLCSPLFSAWKEKNQGARHVGAEILEGLGHGQHSVSGRVSLSRAVGRGPQKIHVEAPWWHETYRGWDRWQPVLGLCAAPSLFMY